MLSWPAVAFEAAMKARRILEGVIATVGLALTGLIAWNVWTVLSMHHPSTENESAFLRVYDPEPLVHKFRAPHESCSESRSLGGTAGTKSVRHNASFDESFPMRTECKNALIAALNDDVLQRLRHSGARILRSYGTPLSGIHFEYQTANTLGSVAIKPLRPGKVVRNKPLCPGLEDVVLDVVISEEWFPKGIPTLNAAVARSIEQAAAPGVVAR
jgi:hypothetical protein